MWVSLKVTHMDVADPVVFLSNVGGGKGKEDTGPTAKPNGQRSLAFRPRAFIKER